jgi:L-fuculose-phosphate aldolase
MLSQFQEVGQALFTQGLVSCYSGNLSVRLEERLLITHRGSILDSIRDADLVETGIAKNDKATPLASSELAVHRAIYKNTSALAVVHAHPPYAVALSFAEQEIIPCDIEGRAVLSKVPILSKGIAVKAGDFAEEIAEAVNRCKVVLVRGHGSFAASQLLEEAYYYTTVLEYSSRLLYLLKVLGVNPAAEL